jgi:hypothetical protein
VKARNVEMLLVRQDRPDKRQDRPDKRQDRPDKRQDSLGIPVSSFFQPLFVRPADQQARNM